VRIGRQAISIDEVSLMLRSGSSEEDIIKEVKIRHIPERIDGRRELELKTHGAGSKLIATLKDVGNVLTKKQRIAFMQLTAEQKVAVSRDTRESQNEGQAQGNAAERERQRKLSLHQENLRNIERNERRQAERESAMDASRYRFEGGRDSGSVRGTYSTPSRRPRFTPTPHPIYRQ
jgi:predicted extracellular nuclease